MHTPLQRIRLRAWICPMLCLTRAVLRITGGSSTAATNTFNARWRCSLDATRSRLAGEVAGIHVDAADGSISLHHKGSSVWLDDLAMHHAACLHRMCKVGWVCSSPTLADRTKQVFAIARRTYVFSSVRQHARRAAAVRGAPSHDPAPISAPCTAARRVQQDQRNSSAQRAAAVRNKHRSAQAVGAVGAGCCCACSATGQQGSVGRGFCSSCCCC